MRDDNAIATPLAFATDQGRGREMADEVRPIRRVVRETTHVGHAGTAADRAGIHIGRCAVEQNAGPPLYQHMPGMISGARDDGNLPFHFEPPAATCASCSQTATRGLPAPFQSCRCAYLSYDFAQSVPHHTALSVFPAPCR